MAIESLKVKNSFYLEVCNMLYQPLGLLTDGTIYSAYDIEITGADNDADKLNFSISEKSPKFKYLVNENMILMDGEYYLIKKISLEESADYSYRFECEHEICSYKEKLNGKIEMIGESPENLINEVCTNVTSPLPIRFGGTDIVGKYRHLISDEQSVFANLVSIAEVFGARLVFKKILGIIHVWLLANPKDKGRFVEKKRDLDSVNLEYDSNEMFTRLHYFGGSDNDTGNEITMHDANPTGKSYIEDFSYYLNQGYSLEDIKSNPNCIREMTIRNQDLTTPEQIYQMALQEMDRICKPKMTATIRIIDLQQIKGYILEPIEIGDLIKVYDRTRNLHLEATVVGISKRSENPLDIDITLSNVIEINSALKDLVNSSQTIDRVTNGSNIIQGVFVAIGEKSLKTELFEHITKITGNTTEINNNKASIEANTKEIALKVSETEYRKDQVSINDRITESELKLEPDRITATVTQNKTFTNIIDGTKLEMDVEATKKLEEYKGSVDKEFEDVKGAITGAKDYIDGIFKDGILTEVEKEGLKVQINQIRIEEKDVEKKYMEIYYHSMLINKETLKQAYDQYMSIANDLTKFLESLLLLTNIEIGHTKEKDRLFRLYEEYLANVQTKFTMALDEIATNRNNDLQSNIEEQISKLDVSLEGITATVGKNTETITQTNNKLDNMDIGSCNFVLQSAFVDENLKYECDGTVVVKDGIATITNATQFDMNLGSAFGAIKRSNPLSLSAIASANNSTSIPMNKSIGGNINIFSEDYAYINKSVKDLKLNLITVPVVVSINGESSNEPIIEDWALNRTKAYLENLKRDNLIKSDTRLIFEPHPLINGGSVSETAYNPSDKAIFFEKWKNLIINTLTSLRDYEFYGIYIGTNFQQFDTGEANINHWSKLCKDIKTLYKNHKIIYRTNWWITAPWDNTLIQAYNDKLNNPLWGLVDVISVAAYFELNDKANPTTDELYNNIMNGTTVYNRGQKIFEEVKAFYDKWNKPVMFGELGCPSKDYGALNPWSNLTQNIDNEAVQSNLFEAYNRAFVYRNGEYDNNWFLGYSIFTLGTKSSEFNVVGKQAQQSIVRAIDFIESNSETSVKCRIINKDNNNTIIDYDLPLSSDMNMVGRVCKSLEFDGYDKAKISFELNKNVIFRLSKPMLVQGEKMVSWNPSPQDSEGYTDNKVSTVSKELAELKIESGKISQTVSSHTEQIVSIDGAIQEKITIEQANSAIEQKANNILMSVSASGGGNLTDNSGFSAGKTNWSEYEYAFGNPDKHTSVWEDSNEWILQGTKAMAIICGGHQSSGEYGFEQRIGVKKNQDYTLSALMARHRADGGFHVYDVDTWEWLGNDSILESEPYNAGKDINSWKKMSVTFNTGNRSTIGIRFKMTKSSDNGHIWVCQPMLNEGTISAPWIEKAPSSSYVEQQLTASSITSKVTENLNAGGNVKTATMELNANGFHTTSSSIKTSISGGVVTVRDAKGFKVAEINRNFQIFNSTDGHVSDFCGGIRSSKIASEGKAGIELVMDDGEDYTIFSTTQGNGGIDDAADMWMRTNRIGDIHYWKHINMHNYMLKDVNINQDIVNTVWIGHLGLRSNQINTNHSGGNLHLNYWRGSNVAGGVKTYVGNGVNDGSRGTLYCANVNTNTAYIETKSTDIGSKASFGVTALDDFIEDMYFSECNDKGECIIAFSHNFIAQANTDMKYHVQVTGYEGSNFKIERNPNYVKLTRGQAGEEISIVIKAHTRGQEMSRYKIIENDEELNKWGMESDLQENFNEKYNCEEPLNDLLRNTIEKNSYLKTKRLEAYANDINKILMGEINNDN